MSEETGDPQQITNAVLKEGLTQQQGQLKDLWTINRDQSAKLAKLEDVPEKLDRLLAINTNMAAMQQIQLQHGADIKKNTDDLAALETKVNEHAKTAASKFSYYAGAAAVIVLVGSFFLWLAQQTVQSTFAELTSLHNSIQSLQEDVSVLQFKTEAPPTQGAKK